jgi:HEAT repeat protein
LKDKDKVVRERVTEALGKIGEPAVVKSLVQNLSYNDPIVRKRAAMVLGEIGGQGP